MCVFFVSFSTLLCSDVHCYGFTILFNFFSANLFESLKNYDLYDHINFVLFTNL